VSAVLRPGDVIAGHDVDNGTQRTGIVTECAAEPEGARWRVVIETADRRKRTATATRRYTVWWPVVGP
jgi:hypothetical protein